MLRKITLEAAKLLVALFVYHSMFVAPAFEDFERMGQDLNKARKEIVWLKAGQMSNMGPNLLSD